MTKDQKIKKLQRENAELKILVNNLEVMNGIQMRQLKFYKKDHITRSRFIPLHMDNKEATEYQIDLHQQRGELSEYQKGYLRKLEEFSD